MPERWVFKVVCRAGGQGGADSLSSLVCQGNRRDMGVCVTPRDLAAAASPLTPPSSPAGVQALVRGGPRGSERGTAMRWMNAIIRMEEMNACIMSVPEGGGSWGGERDVPVTYVLAILNGLCLSCMRCFMYFSCCFIFYPSLHSCSLFLCFYTRHQVVVCKWQRSDFYFNTEPS